MVCGQVLVAISINVDSLHAVGTTYLIVSASHLSSRTCDTVIRHCRAFDLGTIFANVTMTSRIPLCVELRPPAG